MPRKKKPDPKLERLHKEQLQARLDFDRWLTRLKRAFHKLEEAQERIKRVSRRFGEYMKERQEKPGS